VITSYEALAVLLLLLPGIIGFFLFNQVSDLKVKDPLSTISWVIFYLIVSQLIAVQLFGSSFLPDVAGANDKETQAKIVTYLQSIALAPLLIGALLGIVFALLKNFSVGYYLLKVLRISHKIGGRLPWNAMFNRKRGIWIIVRFKDGTSLVGWPEYYSDDETSNAQQLYVQDATWYVPESKSETFVPSSQISVKAVPCEAVLLQDMKNVVAIEFKE
jgi:Family of unknown function (DUF6338)